MLRVSVVAQAPLHRSLFTSIQEIQQKLKDMAAAAALHTEIKQPELTDYAKLETPELQSRYDKTEQWIKDHQSDPRLYIAQIRLKQMNKILAARILM